MSFSTFENDFWRQMHTAQHQYGANGENSAANAAFLSIDQLKKYITDEFNITLIHINYLLALKVEQSNENTFAQATKHSECNLWTHFGK